MIGNGNKITKRKGRCGVILEKMVGDHAKFGKKGGWRLLPLCKKIDKFLGKGNLKEWWRRVRRCVNQVRKGNSIKRVANCTEKWPYKSRSCRDGTVRKG